MAFQAMNHGLEARVTSRLRQSESSYPHVSDRRPAERSIKKRKGNAYVWGRFNAC